MNPRILRELLTVAALMTASLPALAQQGGFYFGASAGTTDLDVCGSLGGLGLTGCDDKDSGFKVYAGKGITPNLAVEAGWVDLGKATATGPGGAARVKVDGIQAAALGILPINPRFRAFGKAGLYAWDVSASGPGGSLSDDGVDIMFGLGVAWNLAPRLGLRAEWERFDVDGDGVDLLSVGVQYSF